VRNAWSVVVEHVLDVLHLVLEARLRLVGLALGDELLVIGRVAGGFLDLALTRPR